MTDFEKTYQTYQNYNPRQAALDETRALLTAAAKAAMADGTLPAGMEYAALHLAVLSEGQLLQKKPARRPKARCRCGHPQR